MAQENTLLDVVKLTKVYTSGRVRTTQLVATKDVSFQLHKGEIISLVGESGSGKSTIANIILRLLRPTSGHIYLNGKDIFKIKLHDYYKSVQMVFQNPFGSFNPFYRVERVLNKAVDFVYENSKTRAQKDEIVFSALRKMDINPEEVLGRFPHQLSGGQLQRFLLARVLIIRPEVLLADEPTTMIDASSRAGILNQLINLGKTEGLSVIFITHDIGQAQYVSDKALVLRQGEVVEQGPSKEVFLHPTNKYTKQLLEDVPSLYRKWKWRFA